MALFKIFKKDKKVALKEISIEDVTNYIETFLSGSGLDTRISVIKRDLASKVLRLDELLNELEHVKLKEEKVIPERVKSIFEGNRRAFIDKVRAFMAEINIPKEIEQIDTFLEEISEKLNALSEDTQKNYFVLKEFVEDQIRPVTAKIKDIDNVISNARSEFDKTPLAKVKEVRALHKKYFYLLGEIESLKLELEHTLKMKNDELDRKTKFDTKLSQLKETKSYEEYLQLLAREEKINEKISQLEQDFKVLFSKLDYALKKRHNLTQDETIGHYLEHPIKGLIADTALKITNELNHIRINIGELGLKKEKRESILLTLEEIGEEKISTLRKELIAHKDELESVISRLKDNHYERSLKEREHWLESVNKNIEAIEKKEKDIEELIERLNPKFVKQKIKDLLRLIDDKVELR